VFEAQAVALAAERAARLHLEAEMADQKACAARLETLLREMRRARFGPRSEKLHPDQLALALEEIETAIAEAKTGHARRPAAKAGKADAPERPKPHRALPADLPRIAAARHALGHPLFCVAYASWQKGGAENANGRIRRWLPRGTDLEEIDEADIQ
jgi:hypothetical protein